MENLDSIHMKVREMVNTSAREQGIMTLGDLRGALRMLPTDTRVRMEGGDYPCSLASYRGYYERLAIASSGAPDPDGDRVTEVIRGYVYSDYEAGSSEVTIGEPTVGELIKALDLADGEVFEGYKGGQYEMHAGTYLHAAEYGDTGNCVTGLKISKDGSAVITTAEEVW